MLIDKNGRRISYRDCDCADADVASGLAIARNPNRMLGAEVGDTPFGVYGFGGTQGGTPDLAGSQETSQLWNGKDYFESNLW